MKYYAFDIETGPLPDEELEKVKPKFEAPSNWKDEAKIQANIEEKETKWKERAALDAMTGRVLCIGLFDGENYSYIQNDDSERQLLKDWWAHVTSFREVARWIGWNIYNFDLKFLVRRSYFHRVTPALPNDVQYMRRDCNFHDCLLDWTCGDRSEHASLDTVSKFLGLEGKNGKGDEFAKHWYESRDTALAYLRNDLHLTYEVGCRLGAIKQNKIKMEELDL